MRISVSDQRISIQRRFPQFRFYVTDYGIPTWKGFLHPKFGKSAYNVVITYKYVPLVFIINPLNHDVKHIYKFGSLCLYHPNDGDWNSGKLISETIIPWTAEWLMYYELWLVTGIWYGKEARHGKYQYFERINYLKGSPLSYSFSVSS